jgi:lysozyme family protein
MVAAEASSLKLSRMLHQILCTCLHTDSESHTFHTFAGQARNIVNYNHDVYTDTVTSNPTAWKWSAIEALCHDRYSVKSDVWSFAIVLFELCSVLVYKQISTGIVLEDAVRSHTCWLLV